MFPVKVKKGALWTEQTKEYLKKWNRCRQKGKRGEQTTEIDVFREACSKIIVVILQSAISNFPR